LEALLCLFYPHFVSWSRCGHRSHHGLARRNVHHSLHFLVGASSGLVQSRRLLVDS
jgi:hypothetical protein